MVNFTIMYGRIAIILCCMTLLSCGSGIDEELQQKWVLTDITGELATDEWKAMMKLDTIFLDLQAEDVLDAIWYNPDTAGATTHGTGTWFIVPEDNCPGKLVLQWDNDNMDRVVIEDLTTTKMVIPMEFGEDTLRLIFEVK